MSKLMSMMRYFWRYRRRQVLGEDSKGQERNWGRFQIEAGVTQSVNRQPKAPHQWHWLTASHDYILDWLEIPGSQRETCGLDRFLSTMVCMRSKGERGQEWRRSWLGCLHHGCVPILKWKKGPPHPHHIRFADCPSYKLWMSAGTQPAVHCNFCAFYEDSQVASQPVLAELSASEIFWLKNVWSLQYRDTLWN